jgi:hypothetical protein
MDSEVRNVADGDGFVSVPTAMRLLGIGRSRLLALVARGRLTGKSVGGRLFVDRASLDAVVDRAASATLARAS